MERLLEHDSVNLPVLDSDIDFVWGGCYCSQTWSLHRNGTDGVPAAPPVQEDEEENMCFLFFVLVTGSGEGRHYVA